MTERFFRLLQRHQRLDEALRSEMQRPLPDQLRMQALKRLKLRVKDRLAHMMKREPALIPATI